jgi:cell division control protein 6
LLHGPHGSGKRACLDAVLSDLVTAETDVPIATTAVDCIPQDSPEEIDARAGRLLGGAGPIEADDDRSLSEIVESASDTLSSELVVLVVLDGFTALDEPQAVLERVANAAAGVPEVHVGVFGASANESVVDKYGPNQHPSVFDRTVRFDAYDRETLTRILAQRAALAFKETTVTDAAGAPTVESDVLAPVVIDRIADVVAGRSGSARRALDLLSRAGKMAERESAEVVTETHTETAIQEIEATRTKRLLRGETHHCQLVAFAIASLERDSARRTTGRVTKRYRRLVQHGGQEPVGARQVARYLSKLDEMGFSNKQSAGNEHRHSVACASPEVAVEALGDLIDSRDGFGPFDSIENYEEMLLLG